MSHEQSGQRIIDAYLRQRQNGVLSGNEILLRVGAMRALILELAALGVPCHFITGWYPWYDQDERKTYLVEDMAADFVVPVAIDGRPDDAARWALDRLDHGMGPQHVFVGSDFGYPYELMYPLVEAWRALPGPTYPLPPDEAAAP